MSLEHLVITNSKQAIEDTKFMSKGLSSKIEQTPIGPISMNVPTVFPIFYFLIKYGKVYTPFLPPCNSTVNIGLYWLYPVSIQLSIPPSIH